MWPEVRFLNSKVTALKFVSLWHFLYFRKNYSPRIDGLAGGGGFMRFLVSNLWLKYKIDENSEPQVILVEISEYLGDSIEY